MKGIEIIFIDDLGTDDSMEHVRNTAKEDNRIKILVNETNSGPGIFKKQRYRISERRICFFYRS